MVSALSLSPLSAETQQLSGQSGAEGSLQGHVTRGAELCRVLQGTHFMSRTGKMGLTGQRGNKVGSRMAARGKETGFNLLALFLFQRAAEFSEKRVRGPRRGRPVGADQTLAPGSSSQGSACPLDQHPVFLQLNLHCHILADSQRRNVAAGAPPSSTHL